MLCTTDANAVDSLTAFGTSMDYVTDEDGFIVYEYNVPLQDVVAFIDDHKAAMTDYHACFVRG